MLHSSRSVSKKIELSVAARGKKHSKYGHLVSSFNCTSQALRSKLAVSVDHTPTGKVKLLYHL